MVKRLSPRAERMIEKYLNVRVGPYTTAVPYYMNILARRFAAPVWLGKGLPEEIETEANKIYSRFKPYFENSKEQGYNLLINSGLGIDCSGLVCRILNAHLEETKGVSLYRAIKFSNFISQLFALLRPYTSISADNLTNDLNSVSVASNEVLPGDLIRFSKYHVALVESVRSDKQGKKIISYVESGVKPFYGVQRIVERGQHRNYRRLRVCL